ncbi:hypothetical protein ACFFX1_30120 [Dactylosporangium sucinum]|uniref:Uncharacterized protein n=1 Tax=Dactylosporangium sucinum TaxID=1424081 RepID=A0A917UBI8_9ACTN|nr:hypothetical protein [Dactylosporangium sucinum]GGM69160.1 hypothetical protein GCM10007977_083580 [Dactylosporangium sucinum]
MASQGFRDWVAAGKPYTLIRPAKALKRNLKAHGLTVFDFPDDGHQRAEPPEDHTPYSATGWPGPNARWKARALDIMPRADNSAGRKENADIARQLIRDRDAGRPAVMWIKYLNWTDEQGVCQQERWTDAQHPNRRTTRDSSDSGHVHVSGRSDADDDGRAEDYDPISRMRELEDDMYNDEDRRRGRNVDEAIWQGIVNGAPKAKGLVIPGQPLVDRPIWLVEKLTEVAADAKAGRKAIEVLVSALNAGGGQVDTASILSRMDELAAAEVARERVLLQRIADLEAELAATRQPVA